MDPILDQRSRALEDAFFKKRDEELIAAMRRKVAATEHRQALAAASGIDDAESLDALMAHGVQPDALAALALVPVVEVVWADGHLHENEHRAVLKAVERHGITPGSPAHTLLEHWLTKRPPKSLLALWKAYVKSLMPTLALEARKHLRDTIIGHAREVAEAAGGFLGLARVSAEEQAVLDDMEQAFESTPTAAKPLPS